MKRLILIGWMALVAFTFIMPAAADEWTSIPFVQYQFVPRPEQIKTRLGAVTLPREFAAAPGVRLRFVNIKTNVDDFVVFGALFEPEGKDPASVVGVVHVHGSGSNLFSGPAGFMPRLLSAEGYACLTINTRQHDDFGSTDNFLDLRKDIEAAVHVLKALGHRKIVVHGHSLGTVQSMYYQSTTRDPAVKTIVLSGMFANLPWKSRFILNQDEEKYVFLNKTALEYMKSGKATEFLPSRMGHTDTNALTGTSLSSGRDVPVTAQHFATYRSTDADVANSLYWIRRVTVPILMLRDEGDTIVRDYEPRWLLASATEPGSLVPRIKFISVPNSKGLNPRGHFFLDNQQVLLKETLAWLREYEL
jgi:pimeloyl-ACP methyl ester carboxylesterase